MVIEPQICKLRLAMFCKHCAFDFFLAGSSATKGPNRHPGRGVILSQAPFLGGEEPGLGASPIGLPWQGLKKFPKHFAHMHYSWCMLLPNQTPKQ